MTKNTIPMPEHPTVDWSTVKRGSDGKRIVAVTCPQCGEIDWKNASEVASRIKNGTFTGNCYKDRLLHKRQRNSRPLPAHNAVDFSKTKVINLGKQRTTHVLVTCPSCGTEQYRILNRVVDHVYRGTFTGKCLNCLGLTKKTEWVRLGKGRKLDPIKGYVRIGLAAIEVEDVQLFRSMLADISGNTILEHRFVMSKHLKRPLKSHEFVDHIDGNKQNNDIVNLRVYVTGNNMPGDMNGHGLYYQEWQEALTRIRELESLLQ